jgi:teichuronic acid exporter
MNLGDSIRSGIKWLLLGSTGGQVLQFAFGIVLARLLVPADFGMIVTIQIFTGFVAMFASGGMGQSLIRAKEVTEDDFSAVFVLQLAIGILVYCAFFFAAPWIARYLENPLYSDLLKVSALNFILRPLSFVRVAWLNREMKFKERTTIDLISSVFTGVASMAMAAMGLGVWSLIWGGIAGTLITIVMLAYVTPVRLRLRYKAEIARRHSGFGMKITANDFLDYVRDEAVNLMLSKIAGPAFLGLFNKAASLARMPGRMLVPPTAQTVFRALSKVQDNPDSTKYIFYRTITLLCVYLLPCLVGLWWIAEPFVEVVYGQQWMPAALPMSILLIGASFRIINNPCGILLAAQNRLNQELVGQVIGVVFTLIACVIGLQWGMVGVAWAIVASNVFYAAYNFAIAYRTIRTTVADLGRAISPPLALNVALFGVLATVHGLAVDLRSTRPALYLCTMVAVGFLAYAGMFLLVPLAGLQTEAARWRQAAHRAISTVRSRFL